MSGVPSGCEHATLRPGEVERIIRKRYIVGARVVHLSRIYLERRVFDGKRGNDGGEREAGM